MNVDFLIYEVKHKLHGFWLEKVDSIVLLLYTNEQRAYVHANEG